MRRISISCILILFIITALSAQQKPVAFLEYYDDESQLSLTDRDGFPVEGFDFGFELSPGVTIKTGKTSAEIRLEPNGSIIKIARNTEFRIEGLQGAANSTSNDFTMFTGKIRMIAATVTGNAVSVRTPTAVCGIRGTDFGLEVIPGMKNSVFLKEGKVEFIRNTGEAIMVGAGEMADALSEMFTPVSLTKDALSSLFSDMEFLKLKPGDVPGKNIVQKPVAADKPASDVANAVNTPEVLAPPVIGGPEDEKEKNILDTGRKGILDGFFAFMSDKLGMEMGSITINNETYAKFVLQPVVSLGKFKAGLYLPVIYTNDLFDPSTWYHPEGNNEWSFGFDEHETFFDRAIDFSTDLMLKIKFVEYGKQRDPFFFKVGNISNVTIGHGIIVRNYANDADFPTIRKVGFNLGLDAGKAGFESLVNNLSEPEFVALRLYLRPMAPAFNAALGITLAADIDPAGDLSETDPLYTSDPIFLNAALDLDIPIIETEPLSIVLFADVAGMIPYFRENYNTDVPKGFYLQAMYDAGRENAVLKNYGAMTGVFGNILMVDYRVDFRLFDGFFKPAFYGPAYDRLRGRYAQDMLQQITSGAINDPGVTMGVYGEAGFSLFTIDVNAGYMWPWAFNENRKLISSEEDFFQVSIAVPEGLIPFLKVHGSVSYSRTRFVPAILSGKSYDGAPLSLFDEYTVLSGQLIYGILPTLDIVATVSTAVVMDGKNIVYKNNGRPEIAPSIGIETRIHF